MFAGRHVSLREVTARLTRRLEAIRSLEVREFVGVVAGHVRAALIESAQAADAEPASDELLEWVRVHQGVETLPEDERELFDLLLYWGMREADVADLLGVSVRRVRIGRCAGRLALDHAMRQGRAGGR
jgi:DNA-directed RNA polymerase specialized sigma24 family protein